MKAAISLMLFLLCGVAVIYGVIAITNILNVYNLFIVILAGAAYVLLAGIFLRKLFDKWYPQDRL